LCLWRIRSEVAIARLYTAQYPKTVSGYLILDSAIANSDTISIFPDPDAPSFDEGKITAGYHGEHVQKREEEDRKGILHGGTNEGGPLRGTIDSLLPYADRPVLEGPTEDAPYVTVVEHDMDLFPKMVEKVSSAIRVLKVQIPLKVL